MGLSSSHPAKLKSSISFAAFSPTSSGLRGIGIASTSPPPGMDSFCGFCGTASLFGFSFLAVRSMVVLPASLTVWDASSITSPVSAALSNLSFPVRPCVFNLLDLAGLSFGTGLLELVTALLLALAGGRWVTAADRGRVLGRFLGLAVAAAFAALAPCKLPSKPASAPSSPGVAQDPGPNAAMAPAMMVRPNSTKSMIFSNFAMSASNLACPTSPTPSVYVRSMSL
mmetsp:Transcript_12385/g.21274  ORF Transcript_12385/g.21274 Transcript_12385/m.21274 type:complete len:226 (+) Transcript_12385:70-747(+)